MATTYNNGMVQLKQLNILNYMKNPKICKTCQKSIPYEKRINNYCNHSCCGIFNRRLKKFIKCPQCKKSFEYTNKVRVFCSHDCAQKNKYDVFIQKWKDGKETGLKGFGVSNFIRRYLFNKYENKCCKCSWNSVNPKSGKIPLQVNHIDGNYRNCKENNLELICPNCHSLTPNFGSLNKGSGRKGRLNLYARKD